MTPPSESFGDFLQGTGLEGPLPLGMASNNARARAHVEPVSEGRAGRVQRTAFERLSAQ